MSRAVSDTVGYVLVFGLIVSTVAVVYVGGFGALADARDTQRFDNAERAFDVLDSNIEDSMVRGAPSRATELRLSDASLEFGPEVSFNVTTNKSGEWYQRTIRPVVYSAGNDGELVYANGAVFRQYDDGAVMFDEPRISDGDRTIIPYVDTYADSGNVSTHNTHRLLVRTDVQGRDVVRFEDVDAKLTVTSPRAEAWQRYLEEDGGRECTLRTAGSDDQVTCSLSGDDIYVQVVGVSVAFS